ncbi:MAG: twin-arginine translocase subunit TatC [Verrucomicrobiales bacterium]|nr:twin-arginine translocase subunit TatC [Verrucomicrobiales bacterium]
MREDASRIRSGADEGYDQHEKPFLDHLEDLRTTLMKIVITLLVTTMIAFAFNLQILQFVGQPMKLAGLGNSVTFMTLAPQEILMLSIKVSFFAGLLGAFPLLMFFAGEFILPGLKEQEKRFVLPGIGAGFFLFTTGAAFAFYAACPIALNFFFEFQKERTEFLNPTTMVSDGTISAEELISADSATEALKKDAAENETSAATIPRLDVDPKLRAEVLEVLRDSLAISADSELHITFDQDSKKLILSTAPIHKTTYQYGKYINFVTRLVLVFGLAFQLPVVVTILVKLQLLTARVMRTTRPMAWIVMLILSAIFTPPDIMTLGLLAGPLIILYEICIWIAWSIENQREKAARTEEDDRQLRLGELYAKSPEDLSEEEKAELHAHETAQYEAEHPAEQDEENDTSPGISGYDDVTHNEHDEDNDHDESWHQDQNEYHQDEDHYKQGNSDTDTASEAWSDHDHDDDLHGTCEPAGEIINLNSATLEELQTLAGVGPALAQRLINHRPFGTFDDVLGVPGISEDKLNRIIDRLIIE